MATFRGTTFTKHDDYMTPVYAWDNIKHLIPRDKVIWEAFFGDGTSGNYLREMGFRVIDGEYDFFENDFGEIIVSNPPFSKTKDVMLRLKELDKPFILIMPSSKINTSYFRKFQMNNENPIQLIIPRKRIHFLKLVDGERVEGWKNACNFDCFYYCWKMNFDRDIIWLDE